MHTVLIIVDESVTLKVNYSTNYRTFIRQPDESPSIFINKFKSKSASVEYLDFISDDGVTVVDSFPTLIETLDHSKYLKINDISVPLIKVSRLLSFSIDQIPRVGIPLCAVVATKSGSVSSIDETLLSDTTTVVLEQSSLLSDYVFSWLTTESFPTQAKKVKKKHENEKPQSHLRQSEFLSLEDQDPNRYALEKERDSILFTPNDSDNGKYVILKGDI